MVRWTDGANGANEADPGAVVPENRRFGARLPIVPASTADGWAWVVAAVLGYLLGEVSSVLLISVVAGATGHSHDLSQMLRQPVLPLWVEVTGFVGLWPGFLGAAFIARRRWGTGRVVSHTGLLIRRSDVLYGGIVGVAAQLVLLPLLYLPLRPFVHNLVQQLGGPARQLTGGSGIDAVITGILTVAVVPVIEEVFFRGLLLRGLLRMFAGAGERLGPALAVLISGLLFGAAHAEGLQFIGLAGIGIVLSLLAYRTGRLGPSIFAHAAFNLVAVIATSNVGVLH